MVLGVLPSAEESVVGSRLGDIVCPLNEGEEGTQRKTWRRTEASVLPVCFFLWSTVSYPTTLSGQGTALDLGIDDLVSRKNSKQKTIYLGPQVSLGLDFHFGGTRLPSDSWRQGWRFGYALVLYCFTCVLCLYVCLQTTSVLHRPSLPPFKAQSLWKAGPRLSIEHSIRQVAHIKNGVGGKEAGGDQVGYVPNSLNLPALHRPARGVSCPGGFLSPYSSPTLGGSVA